MKQREFFLVILASALFWLGVGLGIGFIKEPSPVDPLPNCANVSETGGC